MAYAEPEIVVCREVSGKGPILLMNTGGIAAAGMGEGPLHAMLLSLLLLMVVAVVQ